MGTTWILQSHNPVAHFLHSSSTPYQLSCGSTVSGLTSVKLPPLLVPNRQNQHITHKSLGIFNSFVLFFVCIYLFNYILTCAYFFTYLMHICRGRPCTLSPEDDFRVLVLSFSRWVLGGKSLYLLNHLTGPLGIFCIQTTEVRLMGSMP